MITIINGTTKKPISTRRLIDFIAKLDHFNGFLYTGYPIIGTVEGAYPIDALLITKETGLVIFDLIEGRETSKIQEAQDDNFNKIESRLRSHKALMKGRSLKVPINTVTYAPVINDITGTLDATYPFCNDQNLGPWIQSLEWNNPEDYEILLSVIQAISTIRKGRKKREIKKPDSRGAKLKRLEDSIANLDSLQSRAVIETVQGVQRIRGLAGSGKTIILALKAAYLHSQHPEWKIAVTFHTRSLKAQFKQLINTFVIEQTKEEPDWENLHIIHAWGAPGGGERAGIYYAFCTSHGVEYLDYGAAKDRFGRGNEFKGACRAALEQIGEPSKISKTYDVVLIDEAQDLPPEFLKMCYEILHADKHLVYAYDELQNLNSQALPPPEEIFGNNPDGSARVRFLTPVPGQPMQDITLDVCYRNSRPVLAAAHGLGFGIYRDIDPVIGTGLVQIFDHHELWSDVGYKLMSGALADGEEVVLARTKETSPEFLESHSTIDDLIQFVGFETKEEQAIWLSEQIKLNISEDELIPDDILVINPNPISTRNEVGPVRNLLYADEINSHLAGVDTSPDIFFNADSDSIAFTGIHRAKGNEAGMVYIMNAQDCYTSWGNSASIRNSLFTAITRSKAWVRVLGVGENFSKLNDEFITLKENNFALKFTYPTEEQRKHLNIVNRDMTAEERKHIQKNKEAISKLVAELESGHLFAEDLGAEVLERLKSLIEGGGE
ncbi:MAG: ATP-binding domain-containing protein [Candidatus Marinimicrobia bacterium]|nr:ATP-binding domain-containing protein [Candidatus Neomarinimicrobiota bacterium]